MTTVLETCLASPPPGSAELTLPLTFFDMLWLHFHPIRRVLFYDFPCSRSDFLQSVIPQLKESLSIALKHYLPVAGNLVYPLTTDEKPVLRYSAGDSVLLVIAESSSDFDELVGNHARDADQFYDFVPELPLATDEPGRKIVPLIAVKVTVFPGRGICLGLANHHTLGDGNSVYKFMLAWASICKSGGDEEFLIKNGESLPIFERSMLKATEKVDTAFWNAMGKIPLKKSSPFPIPTNRVRATFILTQSDLNKLKILVTEKKPNLVHVSSFVVSASYTWSCLIKSDEKSDEQVEEDSGSKEIFFFPADARGRQSAAIDPPVPMNYFGNCLGGGIVMVENGKLVAEDGFVDAAESIADVIETKVNNKDEFLKGMENWVSYMGKFAGITALGVSGSPKFDLPNADFGWGRARKLEVISMDGEKYTMSLCKSREFAGGLEIGLSLPKERMEAFDFIFSNGIKS